MAHPARGVFARTPPRLNVDPFLALLAIGRSGEWVAAEVISQPRLDLGAAAAVGCIVAAASLPLVLLAPEHLLASIALSAGLFFFAYAAKYYLTITAVLGAAILGSRDRKRIEDRRRSARRARQPFVSVHLALYNERRVVERLLTACTSFDYDNYEVIVVDDSTDGTTDVLARWKEHPRVTVVHRATRTGFKGGALQEAIRRMRSDARYVVVFDADFVPPPDAIARFLDYFNALPVRSRLRDPRTRLPPRGTVVAVQGYQRHVLNASENWITQGVRAEFSGSYVLERAGQELFATMKMIAGSVYMIRADVLRKLGWSTSITEDWELTLRLYLAGYKVLYTPYVEAPAECVSTIPRLIRQRMRWARGHTYNVKRYFFDVLRSPNLTRREKLEFCFYAPYYLQAATFAFGTIAWLVAELVARDRLPSWTALLGWCLMLSNLAALPLMNLAGLLLEGALRRHAGGLLSFVALSWLLVPFQGYAALLGLLETREGGWSRTPKSGRVTDASAHLRFARVLAWTLPRRSTIARARRIALDASVAAIAGAILALGLISFRSAVAAGSDDASLAIPAFFGTALPLGALGAGWRLRRPLAVAFLAFAAAGCVDIAFLANAVPAQAAATESAWYLNAGSASGCAGDLSSDAPTAAADTVLSGANHLVATFCAPPVSAPDVAHSAVVALWFANPLNQPCLVDAEIVVNDAVVSTVTLSVGGDTFAPASFTANVGTLPAVAVGDRVALRLTWDQAHCAKTDLYFGSLAHPALVDLALAVPERIGGLAVLAAPLSIRLAWARRAFRSHRC